MSHDPLETVLRLRRLAVDASQVALIAGIATATQANDAARAAERSIVDETHRASCPNGDDSLVEALAAWLPAARQRVAQARARHDDTEAEVARCRAELTACRTAFESIEALRDRRLAERESVLAAAEQRSLDDVAARPCNPRA